MKCLIFPLMFVLNAHDEVFSPYQGHRFLSLWILRLSITHLLIPEALFLLPIVLIEYGAWIFSPYRFWLALILPFSAGPFLSPILTYRLSDVLIDHVW